MKKHFSLALCLLASATLLAQTQVTADKTGTELQAAIDAAESGTTVYVQAGTYYGNFTMKDGVNVSGGWNEDFTAQTDYATILDANADGRVVNQAEAFSTLTVWSNLTIQNGQFTSQYTDQGGSGVALFANGQVKHCLIQNNKYTGTSGTCNGGGVFNNAYTDKVLVDDCIIRGNTASHGGGVRICGVIQNSIIENNTTTLNACGGVQLHYGGAMYNCIIRGNTGVDTGGVRITGTQACTVANCLIVDNHATNTIGGLQMANNVAHLAYNNTIVGNTQASAENPARCGVHLNVAAAAKFVNNIVWGNTANGQAQTDQLQINGNYNQSASANFLNNAIVRPSTYGTSTVLIDKDTDPGFVDASENNFRLLYTSSLINAGNNTYTKGSTDLDGIARIAGGTVDLGCYELPHFTLTIADFAHVTLTVGGNTMAAGEYALPQGYTATATVVADEGYRITSVKYGETTLEAAEGVYTLPALTADATLAITVEQIMVNLTIAEFEHATLTVTGQGVLPAGTYPVPYGYTTTATLTADEGWSIKSVKLDAEELVAAEGVYTLPELKADATLTIEVEKSSTTALEQTGTTLRARKTIADGQVVILRNGATYNVLGELLK
ncbi:MAG: hypothetical protein IJ814_06370 [Paludibacteraceae bacterium]|nr:hypothetical protein [Paludibacteraceae bacterium]